MGKWYIANRWLLLEILSLPEFNLFSYLPPQMLSKFFA